MVYVWMDGTRLEPGPGSSAGISRKGREQDAGRAGRQCMHIHPTDEVTPLASRETDGRAEDRLVQHGGGGKKKVER